MPDIFDNFFGKINTAMGGKTRVHYTGGAQVNTGRFYSYHENGTNNKYWMPQKPAAAPPIEGDESVNLKVRMGSVSSAASEPMLRGGSISSEAMSRKGSVASEMDGN